MRSRHFIPIMCFAAGGLLAYATATAQVRDVELKAAYIYNFVQFTVWPDGARAKEPFIVCASPDSALWGSLQAFNGKIVNNRAWSAVDAASRLKQGACDVLVLPRAAERPVSAQGMLVVRDGSGRGPIAITLVDGGEQIRFDVDTEEALRNGLRFSSKLLRLARNVI
jgi:hypothetical protein